MKLMLAATLCFKYEVELESALESFYYAMNKGESVEEYIKLKGQDNFILDSGAFSMMGGNAGKLDKKILKEYVDKYCDYVVKYNIKNFIELDIDSIIGYTEVKKINRYIEEKVGRKPMYVHHLQTRTIDDLNNACKESDYICWGGIAKARKNIKDIDNFCSYIRGLGTRAHMLGYSPPFLENCKHLYSCDSTSWSSGVRGVSMYSFNNNKLTYEAIKNKKRISDFGIQQHNLEQWVKYQKFLKTKGWITT